MKTYNPSLWIRGARTALVEAAQISERPLAPVIAKIVPSDGNKESYPWIGEAHAMRLLKDELETVGLSDALYEITNEKYAIGLEVDQDQLDDDQLGAIMERVTMMGTVALNFPNKLLISALVNGTSLGGYDGVSFFNDAHPIRNLESATQDNLLAGSGATAANILTDLSAGVAALTKWKGENNEPLSDARSDFVAMCPADLLGAMNVAIHAQLVSNTSNVQNHGLRITPVVSARLTDVNDWYLLDVTSGRRPLIYQERRRVRPEFLGPGSDYWVTKEKALFKFSWRGNVGYGHHGTALKFVNS